MRYLKLFFLTLMVIISSAAVSFAYEWKPISGEMSIGFEGIRFKDMNETKPLLALEIGSRNIYYGYSLLLGAANIENQIYEISPNVYSQSIDYYPIEFNVKGYYQLKDIELGFGGGLSMNYLSYSQRNETADKDISSKDNVLFGAQLKGEIKFLFPSSSGVDAFVSVEYVYQFVEKTNTFLGPVDLSNQRLGIKLGGRF